MARKGLSVLFVAYGGGHIRMVLPVMRLLAERGKHRASVLALTAAAPVARSAGLHPLGFADFFEESDPVDASVIELGRQLSADLPTPPVDARETAAYLGASYADLVVDLGEREAKRQYSAHGRQCFSPVRSMRRILERLKPDLLVVTNSPRAERAAVFAANELGIPSVCLVDLFAVDEVAWIGQPGFAKRVCVLNDGVRQLLLRHGRRPEEIVVTGNPAFDDLFAREWYAQAKALRPQLLGANPSAKRLMLVAGSIPTETHPFRPHLRGDPLLNEKLARNLKLWQQGDVDHEWAVWFKPHPSQAATLSTKFEGLPVCDRSWPLQALLHASDAVMVVDSTVAVEAHLIGKPVGRVLGSLFDSATPFQELGITQFSCPAEELPSHLQQFSAQTACESSAPESRSDHGGQAAREVLRVIFDCLR